MEKKLLFANTIIKIVEGISFFALNKTNIKWKERIPTWKSYGITKNLLIFQQVKQINKHKSAHTDLEKHFETFFIYFVT